MRYNIYEFDFGGAKDWVIAPSKKRAIELHQGESGLDDEDYNDIVSFVKKKDWKNYNYWEEDTTDTMTFEHYMKYECYEERFFCSTEY